MSRLGAEDQWLDRWLDDRSLGQLGVMLWVLRWASRLGLWWALTPTLGWWRTLVVHIAVEMLAYTQAHDLFVGVWGGK